MEKHRASELWDEYGVLVAALGATSLWHDPLTDKSIALWIMLCGMISLVWAATLTLPLLLASVLKLGIGACFGSLKLEVVSISLVLHTALDVTAAVLGVIEQKLIIDVLYKKVSSGWSSHAAWSISAFLRHFW